MKGTLHRLRPGSRRGQGVVEFALLVPVLLLLLMGIIELGWLMNVNLQVTNAAREGARAASVGKTTTNVNTRVTNFLNTYNITPVVTIQYSQNNGSSWTTVGDASGKNNAPNGSLIRVNLQVTHKQLTNFIPGLNNFTFNKSVTMTREPT
ncbi:MAG: TadE/TadG family type IV pilus assembly protein [Candidatus Methylacidiphilales bacterium]|nr:TadE/TadG family type IV pilus assembly protein [Candidatus Methylacidiphilales bacterium]